MEITTHRNLNHKTCNTTCKICRAIYIDCQWGFGGAVVAFHLSEERSQCYPYPMPPPPTLISTTLYGKWWVFSVGSGFLPQGS